MHINKRGCALWLQKALGIYILRIYYVSIVFVSGKSFRTGVKFCSFVRHSLSKSTEGQLRPNLMGLFPLTGQLAVKYGVDVVVSSFSSCWKLFNPNILATDLIKSFSQHYTNQLTLNLNKPIVTVRLIICTLNLHSFTCLCKYFIVYHQKTHSLEYITSLLYEQENI